MMDWKARFAAGDRLQKLARRLDALADRDQARLRRAEEIAGWRRQGARELHALCAALVGSLNGLLAQVRLELSPAEFVEEGFRESGKNIYQINTRGRLLQMTFESTAGLSSTERLRIPHILEGATRWFNQERLDGEVLDEHGLFYCLEKSGRSWQFFDQRTQRIGAVDEDYLVGLLEQLL